MHAVSYTKSLERKHLFLKTTSFYWCFWNWFRISLSHLLTFRRFLVNTENVDKYCARVIPLCNFISSGSGSFVFCNRSLEVVVVDMRFFWGGLHSKLSYLFVLLLLCTENNYIIDLGKTVSEECQKNKHWSFENVKLNLKVLF